MYISGWTNQERARASSTIGMACNASGNCAYQNISKKMAYAKTNLLISVLRGRNWLHASQNARAQSWHPKLSANATFEHADRRTIKVSTNFSEWKGQLTISRESVAVTKSALPDLQETSAQVFTFGKTFALRHVMNLVPSIKYVYSEDLQQNSGPDKEKSSIRVFISGAIKHLARVHRKVYFQRDVVVECEWLTDQKLLWNSRFGVQFSRIDGRMLSKHNDPILQVEPFQVATLESQTWTFRQKLPSVLLWDARCALAILFFERKKKHRCFFQNLKLLDGQTKANFTTFDFPELTFSYRPCPNLSLPCTTRSE